MQNKLHWLSQKIHQRAWHFIQLIRINNPIGTYLLLWPTLTALWIAGAGIPSWQNICIFILGVILTRSAGCAINDYADRHIDKHVKRTKERPITSGNITPSEAIKTSLLLLMLSFILVLFTNKITVILSIGALLLAACYPYMKRYTFYPQFILGAAFSWGILMAFTAETERLPKAAWLLYAANVVWTIAYDTYYAMADQEDDLKIGVKSTAIAFGQHARTIILLLQIIALILWLTAGLIFQLSAVFYAGLFIALLGFLWQFKKTFEGNSAIYLQAFKHNHWIGLIIFISTLLSYLIKLY
ncbi:UNVERIFIED_CONTAM: hypothetical protein GTU68_060400 [Idotea baltica]|nr:hypothetical protein [Idotea baltica]